MTRLLIKKYSNLLMPIVRGFADDGELRRYNSNKFSEIIEPIIQKGEVVYFRVIKVAKRGRGLLPRYKVAKSHDSRKDFVYWNDPNELVDRLRLLVAERSAGNNAHDNEITSHNRRTTRGWVYLLADVASASSHNMSVDVFGRVLNDKQKHSRGVPGIGYKLTEDGLDFDIEDRRLCNVGAPADARDAINFETLYFNINSISEANEKVKNNIRSSNS
ncbi:unnamed protein product [Trichogramma brassicae]|uniref:Uncharacterized protein n=1 Tax=Trichogramma brassicae TaxID=86971 RepID=A0A6H5I767_9HYME|nr:unnamed protein product [Trichogramma brassicae]